MTDILKTIKDKLQTLSPHVYYGTAEQLKEWNYIVFLRDHISGLEDKLKMSVYYRVGVVSEGYIEPGTALRVLEAMTSIPGMKIASEQVSFSYIKKPNTNTVVEVMELMFVKAESRQR